MKTIKKYTQYYTNEELNMLDSKCFLHGVDFKPSKRALTIQFNTLSQF